MTYWKRNICIFSKLSGLVCIHILFEQCVALRWHLVGLAKQAASQRAIVSYTTTAEWVERAVCRRRCWDYIQQRLLQWQRLLASASQFSAALFSKHPYLMGAMYIQKRPVFPYRQSPENFGTAKTINRKDMCAVHWRIFSSHSQCFLLANVPISVYH